MQEKGFKEGLQAALPTALGYISIGLAFGIVASASGLSALEVGLMSLFGLWWFSSICHVCHVACSC